MAKLEDLKKSVSDLSDEELRVLLQTVRQSRRVTKKAAPTVAKKASAPKSAGPSLEAMLNALSPEDKAKLVAQLQQGETK